MKKHIRFLFFLFCIQTNLNATNWYVDKDANGLNNGTSWNNAWTSFSAITWINIKTGDTIFISGGPSGGKKIYSESWSVGATGITITLDASNPLHNGIVVFDYDADGDRSSRRDGIFLGNRTNVTIDGNVHGESHIEILNMRNIVNRDSCIAINGYNAHGTIIKYVAIKNVNNGIRLLNVDRVRIHNNKITEIRGDAAIALSDSRDTVYWDNNLIFNNYIETLYNEAIPEGAPLDGNGNPYLYSGPDGIQAKNGATIKNNIFRVSKTSKYTSNQHPDMLQETGNFVKVYNNEFINCGDAIYQCGMYQRSEAHDIWIYNNVFRMTEDFKWPDFFRLDVGSTPCTLIKNIKILNNTIVDNPDYISIHFWGFTEGQNIEASGNEIKNNIFVNCSPNSTYNPIISISKTPGIFPEGAFEFGNNIYIGSKGSPYITFNGTAYTLSEWISQFEPTAKTILPQFVSYTPFSETNDFHLQSIDTIAKNYGCSLSAYFNEDKDGIARPQGSYWDIGAYEYKESENIIDEIALPNNNILTENYPNPFYLKTTIKYSLPGSMKVDLKIYDISGREIVTLIDGIQSPGEHVEEWNGTNSAGHRVSSGIYFYQLKTQQGYSVTKKMLLSE